ncbi:MAG: tetratricopeptide repeat protein [Candidatus Eremiobacteraeota bacterium]|nr:tetratricopeptide repeat protein [Candidatus Eremiobacteraeota bacterium]
MTGTGGVGKTTCALAVAADRLSAYPDGAWFVNLASVGDGSLVPSAIAAAIGLHESQNRPIVDTLMTYLKSKRMLLLLDNCEHLVRAAANIVEVILQTCPHVTVLATTREALGLTGEQTYRLPPLAVPPAEALRGLTATEALSYSAVALFFDGAKRIDHAFVLTDESAPAVAEICRRLDGIALAIELAVARTKTIPVKVLAEKLDQRFRLLTEGSRTALPRQQTLRATIDWSYEFLSKPERTLFRALGTFAGGFTLDLVLALSTDGATNELDVLDRLTSLVEKSLLQAEVQDSGTRYRLLESVREFARERLVECGEMETAVHAHAQAFTHLAERLETEFETKPETTWRGRAEPELENFRVALAWAFGADGDPLLGQRMTAALRPAWFLAPSQGRRWVTTALERVQPDTPGRIVGRLELTAAHLDMLALKNGAAQAAARRALDRLLPLNDVDGVAMAQLFLGGALGLLGDAAEAEPMLQAALTTFRERGARREIGAALGYLGLTRVRTGDLDGSRPLLSEALETYRAIGALRPATHMALTMAEVEYQSGDAEAAIRLAEEALENDRRLLDLDSVVFDLCNLAAYLAALERWDESTSSAREALSLAREREIELGSGLAIQHLAAAAAMRALEADGSENELRARSARLIAYVDAQFEAAGYQRDYTDQQEYDRLTSALEKVLGNEVLALYARDGRTWTEERAAKESLLV